jgi:tripartite-type tricarboxylate transporter receptor subunit TctC
MRTLFVLMEVSMLRFILAALAFAVFSTAAAAYPTKPIRLIVPSPPGGTHDLLARLIAANMSKDLEVSVVVDNRAGAGGTLGSDLAAKAPADGYTVLIADGSALAINTTLRNDLPFDAQKDLTPVSLVARSPLLLLANPSFPANSVKDLVAIAKRDPSAVNYASPGIGTPQHLSGAMLASMAGVTLTHIAYKGGAPVQTDLIAGQVPVAFLGVAPSLPLLRSGKIKALGIASAKRSELLPDVPTLMESGYPKFEAQIWFGCFTPNGVPPEIVTRLAQSVKKALSDPEVIKKLSEVGVEVIGGSPAELGSFLRDDTAKWGALVKSTGAKPE